MAPTETIDRILDPVEALHQSIEQAWMSICRGYEVAACMPDIQTLFAGADLTHPNQSAESVVVAMLQEANESVGRFSPWYKQPARAFGLTSVRDARSGRVKWMLAPEAVQRWQDILAPLANSIRKYSGLIHAMLLVDDLMADIDADPCITAQCSCIPPLTIQLRRSVLEKSEILCDRCLQPFV
jgi:hypothetical protein